LRFGDQRGEEEKAGVRKELVRKAFNSPFHPFVLATTSIGQEGLDFHQYCHRIFHWNLPANPVDLEQREGRIHRYKGHVIRKNIAKAFPLSQVATAHPLCDPWATAFDAARQARHAESDDLVPYWIFETDGGEQVYRHIPILPLSKDCEHLDELRLALAAYRLVLGQPRQEDLLAWICRHVRKDEDREHMLANLRIDLSPPE
jgi:hypothetical protein